MLQRAVVSASTLDLLKELQRTPACAAFSLAGGTSLALQIGHRLSEDLDLFSPSSFDPRATLAQIQANHSILVDKIAPDTLLLRIDGVKVDLLGYPYPRLAEIKVVEDVRMFDLPDIAAMKLSAVSNRGARKDFIDLVFLIQMFGLPRLLGWYQAKFAGHSLFPVIKSLTYFADAEDEPEPVMLKPMDWSAIKRLMTDAVAQADAD